MKPVLQLGQRSYEVYLTHMFVVFAFFHAFLASGKPILGICYGMQELARAAGGTVVPNEIREFGKAELVVDAVHPAPLSSLPDRGSCSEAWRAVVKCDSSP